MAILYAFNGYLAQLLEAVQDGEIDEQVYKDTCEALQGTMGIEEAIKAIRELEAVAEACKKEATHFADKAKRCENGIDTLKKMVVQNMELTGEKKVSAGAFTVSKRYSESVDVVDPDAIPQDYFIPQAPKLDKRAVLKALKDGETIMGAGLKKNPYIVIK